MLTKIAVLAQVFLPFVARAQQVCEILKKVTDQVMVPLVSLLLALAVLFFLYGLIEFVAGASSPEARTTGKRHIIWGIVGIVIMSSAWTIIIVLRNYFGPRELYCTLQIP